MRFPRHDPRARRAGTALATFRTVRVLATTVFVVACGDGAGDAPPPGAAPATTPATTPAAPSSPPVVVVADAGVDAAAEVAGPVAIAAGATHTCALVKPPSAPAGVVHCWGANDVGQLGATDAGVVQPAIPPLAGGALTVAAHGSGNTTCVIDAQSEVWCWGANEHGQAGTAPSPSVPPNRVQIGRIGLTTNLLAVGARHGCLSLDGADHTSVACWGDNATCALGMTDTGVCTPDTVERPSVGNELTQAVNPKVLALGLGFSCSLSADDSVARCWGGNDAAQCAAAPAPVVKTPVEIGAADSIAAGAAFACAVQGGATRCWGSNATHAVSDDPAPTVVNPTPAFPGVDVVAIAAGAALVCVIDTSGNLHCRGSLPGRVETTSAVVDGVEGVTAAAVGDGHVCVIGRRSGSGSASPREVLCWGANASGQADPAHPGGGPLTSPTPVAIPGTP